MSLVLGYATPTNAIIMSDGRAGENGSYSEYYDKTLKVNDNIILGFVGIKESIDMFLDCVLSNMGENRSHYLMDDFLDMVDFIMQDEETKEFLLSDYMIIGRRHIGEMVTCTVGNVTNFNIEKNIATSPRKLYIGGTIDGNIIANIFSRNMNSETADIKTRMKNTIKEVSGIDKSINQNIFFKVI